MLVHPSQHLTGFIKNRNCRDQTGSKFQLPSRGIPKYSSLIPGRAPFLPTSPLTPPQALGAKRLALALVAAVGQIWKPNQKCGVWHPSALCRIFLLRFETEYPSQPNVVHMDVTVITSRSKAYVQMLIMWCALSDFSGP